MRSPEHLADVPPGTIVYTSEKIGDDKNAMEVREVFYQRDPDGPCRHPHNVRVARIGIVQGDPDDPFGPRYRRFADQFCRDPGEADGRIKVRALAVGNVWAREFALAISRAK